MDVRRKDYNFRSHTTTKKVPNSSNSRKETIQGAAKNSPTNAAILSQAPTGGANLADTSTASSASDVSLVEADGLPVAAPIVPPELSLFMKEMKSMFLDFSTQVNIKLDSVVNDIAMLKTELASTKITVGELETGLTDTSDRLTAVENVAIPQMQKYIDKKIDELDEKLTLSEIHDRKQNLLVYGVPSKPNENILETVNEIFCNFLNIPRQDAMMIPLVAAHRLQKPNLGASGGSPDSERQPPAIIVRFARMIDRDRLLSAYEHRPRQPARQQPTPPGSDPTPVPPAFDRVSIRTDLPPKMKRERGRLASLAYNLRKNNNLSTRIKVFGTHILLQTRKNVRNGGNPERWSNYSE